MPHRLRIRVVHITTVPQSFHWFEGLAGFLTERGYEFCGVSSPGEKLWRFSQSWQVPVHAIAMTRRITPLRDVVALAHIWWHLRQVRPSIVHAHTPKAGFLGMIGARLAGVPVCVYHLHGLPYVTATGFRRTLLRWSERLSCGLADYVLCVSHSLRRLAIEDALCSPSRCTVLLAGSIKGVDALHRFNPDLLGEAARRETRTKYGLPADALVLGFVGRLVRDKGLSELAEAWQILGDEFPALHMLVVGDYEPQDPLPAEVRARLRTDQRVHLIGRVDDVPSLYAAMDVLALPTYREGFGLALIEAGAMRLPVVSTRIPGCIDAVEDGVTGFLVPVRDAEALAAAIRTYLGDPELRARHGRAGRERVLRDFRPEALWEALCQEYSRLLKKNGLCAPRVPPQGRRRGAQAAAEGLEET